MNEHRFRYDPPKRMVDPNAICQKELKSYISTLPPISDHELVSNGREVSITAIRSSTTGEYYDIKTNPSFEPCATNLALVEKVLKEHPQTDLLTLGEHSFYYHPRVAEALEFARKEDGAIQIAEGQEEVVNALRDLQELARVYKTNICVGTVCEKESVQTVGEDGDLSIYHNTAVIINSNGEITQIRRKTTGSESLVILEEQENNNLVDKTKETAMSTITPVDLLNKNGDQFRVMVCICAERSNKDFYERAVNSEADVLLLVVHEGDDRYMARSRSRLEEGFTSDVDTSRQWNGDLYIEMARRLRVLKPNGVILAADSAAGAESGVFYAGKRETIKEAKFEDDCVVAKCRV
jgi:predicted amidohydrolase